MPYFGPIFWRFFNPIELPPRRTTPARRSSKEGKEKKKPSWNAYLVWFTQKGNEIRDAEPDIAFGDVGKRLKGQWKQVRCMLQNF